jgi:hypothetical protein
MANLKIVSLGLAFAMVSLTSIQISGSGGFSTTPQSQPIGEFQQPAEQKILKAQRRIIRTQQPPSRSSFSVGGLITSAQPQPAPSTGFTFGSTQSIPQPAQQVSAESADAIKMLSDKVAMLDQAIETMQTDLATLKEIVMRDHSTAIRKLNETLDNLKQ